MKSYVDKFVSPAVANQGDWAQGWKKYSWEFGKSEQKKILDMLINPRWSPANRHQKNSLCWISVEINSDRFM